MILLNIGEGINGGERKLTFARVYAGLRLVLAEPVIATYAKSESEWTFVIQIERRLTDRELLDLSTVLEQEAIAQYDTYTVRGDLIGPLADKWGPFDPKQFLKLNGEYVEA